MQIVAILLLIVALGFGIMTLGFTFSLAKYLLGGLVIGALGRLVLPGRERIGLLGTTVIGLAGGALGGVAGNLLGVGGVLELVCSVVAAAILLAVFGFRAR